MFSCAQSSCSMQWISRLLSDPLSEVGAARPSHEALPRHCDMQPVKKSSGENKVAIILYEAVRRGRSRGSAAGRAAEWQCDPSRTRYCHRITPAATSAQGHVCVCVCVCVCAPTFGRPKHLIQLWNQHFLVTDQLQLRCLRTALRDTASWTRTPDPRPIRIPPAEPKFRFSIQQRSVGAPRGSASLRFLSDAALVLHADMFEESIRRL